MDTAKVIIIMLKNNVKFSDSDAESKPGYGDFLAIEMLCDEVEMESNRVRVYSKKKVIADYDATLVIGWYEKQARIDEGLGTPDLNIN